MGKIIALVNQKGGVGKTTSSINLSASLGVLKKKVLLVDLDPQGNSTTGIGIDKGEVQKSVYDLLIDNATIGEVMIKTKFTNLYALPAVINLAGADIELMEKSRLNPNFSKGAQLKKHLDQVKEQFDYINQILALNNYTVNDLAYWVSQATDEQYTSLTSMDPSYMNDFIEVLKAEEDLIHPGGK